LGVWHKGDGGLIRRAYRRRFPRNFIEAVKNVVINEICRVSPQNILTISWESLILV